MFDSFFPILTQSEGYLESSTLQLQFNFSFSLTVNSNLGTWGYAKMTECLGMDGGDSTVTI
jgi:hypothetical protein